MPEPIALGIRTPAPPADPMEQYSRMLTLRELMDRRQTRALEEQRIRQKMDEETRDRAEYEQFRGALQRGASLSELTAISPKRGIEYGKAQSEQQKAGTEQQKAVAELTKTRMETAKSQAKQYADDIAGLLRLPPAQRDAQHQEMIADYVNKGWWTPEQAAEHEAKGLPGDEEMQALMLRAYGTHYLLETQAKEAEAKAKQAELARAPFLERKAAAEATSAEQKAAGKEPAGPPTGTLREFYDTYLLGWLEQKGIKKPSAQNVKDAYVDFQKAQAPRIAVPGVDVPFSSAVMGQKKELTENKPMSGESATKLSVARSMIPELQQLRTALEKGGRNAVWGILSHTDTNLRRLAENAADKVGRLRSGGAINKQEEERFFGQIARKEDLATGNVKSAMAAIDRLIEEAQGVVDTMQPGAAAKTEKKREKWGRDAQGNLVRQ